LDCLALRLRVLKVLLSKRYGDWTAFLLRRTVADTRRKRQLGQRRLFHQLWFLENFFGPHCPLVMVWLLTLREPTVAWNVPDIE
jgi:hypothetical protein